MSQPRLLIRLLMNEDSRKNELGSAVAFLYFPSKMPGHPSPGRVEGRKGQSGEISDMLLVVQPVKKKLKQKSLLAAGMQGSALLAPLNP